MVVYILTSHSFKNLICYNWLCRVNCLVPLLQIEKNKLNFSQTLFYRITSRYFNESFTKDTLKSNTIVE